MANCPWCGIEMINTVGVAAGRTRDGSMQMAVLDNDEPPPPGAVLTGIGCCYACAQPIRSMDDGSYARLPDSDVPDELREMLRVIREADRRADLTQQHLYEVCQLGPLEQVCVYLRPELRGQGVMCAKGDPEAVAQIKAAIEDGRLPDNDHCEGRRGTAMIDARTRKAMAQDNSTPPFGDGGKLVVVYRPDGRTRVLDQPPSWQDMRQIILNDSGLIEQVRVLDDITSNGKFLYTMMFIDEEGKLRGLKRNPLATIIYQRNVRAAFPTAINPFAVAQEAMEKQAAAAGVVYISSADETEDPYIVGTAIVFHGWTEAEVMHHFDDEA